MSLKGTKFMAHLARNFKTQSHGASQLYQEEIETAAINLSPRRFALGFLF
jgi:hypothetical protein